MSAELILSSRTLREMRPGDVTNVLQSVTDETLDGELRLAEKSHDLKALHLLAGERLRRDQEGAVGWERLSLLRQAADLEVFQRNETYRDEGFANFLTFLHALALDYRQTHAETSESVLCLKKYVTVESYLNIIRHYHKRHGMTLELLAGFPKGKLEVLSGVCNQWDSLHADHIDADVLAVLRDEAVTSETASAAYAKLKGRGMLSEAEANESAGKSDECQVQSGAGGGLDNERGEPAEDAGDSHPPPEQRVGWTLDSETGRLTAWIPGACEQTITKEVGVRFVDKDDVKPLVLGFASEHGIGLR